MFISERNLVRVYIFPSVHENSLYIIQNGFISMLEKFSNDYKILKFFELDPDELFPLSRIFKIWKIPIIFFSNGSILTASEIIESVWDSSSSGANFRMNFMGTSDLFLKAVTNDSIDFKSYNITLFNSGSEVIDYPIPNWFITSFNLLLTNFGPLGTSLLQEAGIHQITFFLQQTPYSKLFHSDYVKKTNLGYEEINHLLKEAVSAHLVYFNDFTLDKTSDTEYVLQIKDSQLISGNKNYTITHACSFLTGQLQGIFSTVIDLENINIEETKCRISNESHCEFLINFSINLKNNNKFLLEKSPDYLDLLERDFTLIEDVGPRTSTKNSLLTVLACFIHYSDFFASGFVTFCAISFVKNYIIIEKKHLFEFKGDNITETKNVVNNVITEINQIPLIREIIGEIKTVKALEDENFSIQITDSVFTRNLHVAINDDLKTLKTSFPICPFISGIIQFLFWELTNDEYIIVTEKGCKAKGDSADEFLIEID